MAQKRSILLASVNLAAISFTFIKAEVLNSEYKLWHGKNASIYIEEFWKF